MINIQAGQSLTEKLRCQVCLLHCSTASPAYAALAYMSNMKYSQHRQYISCMVNTLQQRGPMIEIRIDQLLKAHGRTFYWLAKETGISHTTLWRLKKGKALGINFATLEKLCEALDCQPGDMFTFTNQKKQRTRNSLRTYATRRSASR